MTQRGCLNCSLLTLRSTSSRASGLVLISIFSFAAASSIRSMALSNNKHRCVTKRTRWVSRPGPDECW